MASSSQSSASGSLGGITVTEKLSKGNYLIWKVQVLAVIRGARLDSYLTGATKKPSATIIIKKNEKEVEVSNPAVNEWIANDQQVLGYLLTTMSRDVLSKVATCGSAAALWSVVEGMFSSATRARSINTKITLTNTKKGDLSVAEYVGKIRALADELATSDKLVDEEDLISFIIVGLDEDFEPIISSLVSKSEHVSLGEAYSQLLSFEQRMKLRQEHSANLAHRGRGRGQQQQGRGCGNQGNQQQQQCGRGGKNCGRRRGNTSYQRQGGNNTDNRPKCQLCYKRGHTVIDCWYRYDEDFVPDEKYAGTAASYGVDSNWYVDTGATDHITGELEKLTIRDKYKGQDQVQAANGAGMVITHIGRSIVNTPSRPLYLNNILYVPNANKNLISAYRLMVDNSAFLELYPKHFSLKDQAMKEILLRGRCRGRLFPLPSSSLSTQQDKEALAATTPSLER